MFNLNPGAFKALFIYSFLLKKKMLRRNLLVIHIRQVGDGTASHNHLIVFV